MASHDKYLLTSVRNAFKILRLFSTQTPELGISEISRRTGINKSSVHRLVSTLAQEGFLVKDPQTHRYRLGLSILHLSGIVLSHLEIHREATPVLEHLVDVTGEAAHLGIIENNEVVYLHKVECKQPVRLSSFIGKSNPVHCTGTGKIILAYQPEAAVESIIQCGLPKCGPNSITDPQEFRRELKRIRQQGFVVCIDDTYEGIVSVAAPVRDFTGEVVAGISVVGPKQRMGQEQITQSINHVVKASAEISENLGYYEGLSIQHSSLSK